MRHRWRGRESGREREGDWVRERERKREMDGNVEERRRMCAW